MMKPMALRGNLVDFTLSDVFQLIAMSRKTGVLRIHRLDASRGSVWFRDGEVFFAESNWRRERLGDRLVATQKIAPGALAKAVEIRAAESEGRRLGTILVDEGYISRGVLEAFVQEQILDTIFDLMRWEDGEFDFEISAERPEEDIGLSVSIENIAMESGRRLEEWERIKKKVPSMDIVFKMASAPGEGPFEISLKPIEWNVLLLIDGTRTVSEVAQASGMTDFDVARVVYGLFSGGLLEVVSDEELAQLRAVKAAREQTVEAGSGPSLAAAGSVAFPESGLPGYSLAQPEPGVPGEPAGAGAAPFGAGAGIAELESRYERMREPFVSGASQPLGISPEDAQRLEPSAEPVAPFVESEAMSPSAPWVEPAGSAEPYETSFEVAQSEVISYVEEPYDAVADAARTPLEPEVFPESVKSVQEPLASEYLSPPLSGQETAWPAPTEAPEGQLLGDEQPAPCEGLDAAEAQAVVPTEPSPDSVPVGEPHAFGAGAPDASVDVRMDLSVSRAISEEITELTGVPRSAYIFNQPEGAVSQQAEAEYPGGPVPPAPSPESGEPADQATGGEMPGPPSGWPSRKREANVDKDTLLGIIEGIKRL